MAATVRVATFQLPSGNGSANNVISSDGAGSTSWVALSTLENLPTGYVNGCKLSYVSATQVQVSTGKARDSTDAYNFVIGAALTVSIASAGALGLMSGQTEANDTTYEVYLLGDTTGVNSDSAFLVPAGVTPAQTGYDVFRYLGAVRNDGSGDFIEFYMAGTGPSRKVKYWATFATMQVLSSGSATSWASMSTSDFVPSGGVAVELQVAFESDEALNDNVIFRPNGETDSHDLYIVQAGEAQAAGSVTYFPITVPLSTSRNVDYQGNDANLDTDVAVSGYDLEL